MYLKMSVSCFKPNPAEGGQVVEFLFEPVGWLRMPGFVF